MYGGYLQDMKGGWAASPVSTATPVNPPTLLAVQPLLTQASTPVQTVQPTQQQQQQQPQQQQQQQQQGKLDTSSK